MKPLAIDGRSLTLSDVAEVARQRRPVVLAASARQAMSQSRERLMKAVEEGRTIYGVNTGFGILAAHPVSREDACRLQENIVRSHAVGCGAPFPEEVVRAVLLLKANDLSSGCSGVRPKVAEALVSLLEAGVHPVIPRQGSLAASGDLAPLAHAALVLLGRGRALVDGEEIAGADALRARGLSPLALEQKEGLSLVNGTQVTTALMALNVLDAEETLHAAEIAGAMSLEALRGKWTAFDPRLVEMRPHPGAAATAARLLHLTRGSAILGTKRPGQRLQDPYSLRCMPQVLGAVRDAVAHVREVVARELNARTDNPLVIAETGEVISGGNFHGEPVGLVADYLALASAEIGTIAERRIDLLLDSRESGLPDCLVAQPGLNSGFMISQYTAAALASENKVLAHPASVDTIPTSAGLEDHVSMGCHGAVKARQVIENVTWIVATELVCAAQGLDFLAPLTPGRGTEAARRAVRQVAEHLDADREIDGDIRRTAALARSGDLRRAVSAVVGESE